MKALLLFALCARAAMGSSSDGAFQIDLQEGWQAAPPSPGGTGETEVFRAFVPQVLPPQNIRGWRLSGPPLSERESLHLLTSEANRLRTRGAAASEVERFILAGGSAVHFFTYGTGEAIGAEAMISLASATYRFEGTGITGGTFLDNLDGLRTGPKPGRRRRRPRTHGEAAKAEVDGTAQAERDAEQHKQLTPQEVLRQQVDEGIKEFKHSITPPDWFLAIPTACLEALRWSHDQLAPAPRAPQAPQPSMIRLLAALAAALTILWPLHLLTAGRTSLDRLPWAEEARYSRGEAYRSPSGAHPLASPFELRPVGFGFGKEYWVLQNGRLAYRLLWPLTRTAILWTVSGFAFLFALVLAPAFSGEILGELYLPGLAAVSAGGLAFLFSAKSGRAGAVLNAQGKVVAAVELSSMSTAFEEIFVVLDGERRPLAYFPRRRFERFYRKHWWLCPTHQEYGARIVELSPARSILRRFLGHLGVLRSSFGIFEGDREIGRFTREGLMERGRLEIHVEKSPVLPIIDPRAFLGLAAILAFMDPDPWHPSFLG